MSVERSNEQWLTELSHSGSRQEAALADLRKLLVKGLRYALSKHQGVDASLVEDFAQDALIKILAKLDSFRGESRFTTWAQTIAVREAFTELRRRRWKDVSLDKMVEGDLEFEPDALIDRSAGPEKQARQEMLLKILHRVINEELTEKQRQGIIAEMLNQVPQEEIARQMGTNRNAFYKLIHDARKKLRQGLLNAGVTPEEVRATFDI